MRVMDLVHVLEHMCGVLLIGVKQLRDLFQKLLFLSVLKYCAPMADDAAWELTTVMTTSSETNNLKHKSYSRL